MSLIDSIRKFCAENSEYVAFGSKFDSALYEVRDELRIVPMYFRHFSRHDESHSFKIIQYWEGLLGDEFVERLSMSDKVFLILAAYTHDLGMALNYDQIQKFFDDNDFSQKIKERIPKGYRDLDEITKRILEFPSSVENCRNAEVLKIHSDVIVVIEYIFRTDHAQRSYDKILQNELLNSALGIRGNKLLAQICLMHSRPIQELINLPREENGLFGDVMHPRFVAGMLCLGDLLDLDTDRFDEVMLKASSPSPILSELHKQKHESITHYLVKDNVIEIIADCENHSVYRALNEWVRWIEDCCTYLTYNWDEITPIKDLTPPRLKQCDITIKGNGNWKKYSDSKIHIDTDKAVRLLEGSNVYRGKHEFVRELLQNAVDASLIQLYDDVMNLEEFEGEDAELTASEYVKRITAAQNKHTINISDYSISGKIYECGREDTGLNKDVRFVLADDLEDEPLVVFELTDHGTGISDEELDSIIGMKGKSQSIKNKIESIPEFFRPAGVFGIGIQSAFLVAKRVVYITKTDSEKAKVITINDPSNNGDVYIEDYDGKMHRGTKVLVLMDSKKFTQTDFGCSDYTYKTLSKTGPKRKSRLVLNWLCQKIDNVNPQFLHILEAERSSDDYFNVEIVATIGSDDIKVLNKSSIIDHIIDNGENYSLEEVDGIVKYSYVDLDNNCIFDVALRTAVDEKPKETIVPGCCEKWLVNEYNHNVFYRNAYVEHNRDSLSNEDSLWGRFLDYKINLFSSSADAVLNIGRNSIRDEYRLKLKKLINEEFVIMFKLFVDQCLQDETDSKGKIIIAYIFACITNYKKDEVYKKYNEVIDNTKVDNYYCGDNYFVIPLNELFDTNIYFLKELIGADLNNIPSLVWEDNKNYIDLNSNYYICSSPENNGMRRYNHIITHIIVGEYYTVFNKKNYLVYKTIPYVKDKIADSPEIAEFLRYNELLNVVHNNLRCIHSTKGYKCLETPLSEGLRYCYIGFDRAIEMEMDDKVKEEIKAQLVSKWRIDDANELLKRIESTVEYSDNIDYIFDYHKQKKDGVTRDSIEKEYKKLWHELLNMLADDKYSDFLLNHYDDIVHNNYISIGEDRMIQLYRNYFMRRFPDDNR